MILNDMHQWGDEWFKTNGNDLYKAIDEFEDICIKYGGIKVYGKEKYGTYRDEYLSLWDGGLHYILFSSVVKIENNFIYWKLDPVLKAIFKFTRILKLVQWYQANVYNYAMQKICKKYPNVVDEMTIMIDGYKMIKPGRFGDLDGLKIHNDNWKTI